MQKNNNSKDHQQSPKDKKLLIVNTTDDSPTPLTTGNKIINLNLRLKSEESRKSESRSSQGTKHKNGNVVFKDSAGDSSSLEEMDDQVVITSKSGRSQILVKHNFMAGEQQPPPVVVMQE